MMSGFFESEPSPEGGDFEKVEINLLADFLHELKKEFVQNRWSYEEGFHYILAAGLASLQNGSHPHLNPAEESLLIHDLQAERIRMHGRYSAMKHQVSRLSQEVKSLGVQLMAAKNLCELYRKLSYVEKRGDDY